MLSGEARLGQVLSALRAAADPTRLRLVHLLSHGELTVSEITQVLGQSQPRVSRHLKLMGEAGLLSRHREGAWVFYRLADAASTLPAGAAMIQALCPLLPKDDPVLVRDRERLEEVRAARAAEAAAYFRENAREWNAIRALHMPEAEVETALRDMVGEESVRFHVDLGTGTARMLTLLAPLSERGLGLDNNHDMLNVARAELQRHGDEHLSVRHGDLFELPPEAVGADLVTMHQVLHYLEDPSRAVGEAARLLSPGGRLVIVDFAPHELEFLREAHAHRRLGFADRDIEAPAAAAGLSLIERRHLPPEGAPRPQGERLRIALWLFRRPPPPSSKEAA